MVQISRALAFFALVSTGLALAVNFDAMPSVKYHNGGVEEVKIYFHDTSVNIEFSGTNAKGCSDAIDAATFAENKATINDASAGVADPGLVVKTAAGVQAIRPGSVIYIQNSDGYYLSRIGPTGVKFAKRSPDVYCRFKADPVGGTNYVTLRADNGLPITLDYRWGRPVLWLNAANPSGWFEARSIGTSTKDFLIVRDSTNPGDGDWVISGTNWNDGAIETTPEFKTLWGLLITEA
ncbi:hypothetical protein B0H19DRAFT_1065498 [Mycena capillaripes]|nr:hypothetical protein B0H19DRAFT_1065498 [Mycena capillaripes]